jgi:hypothetical protein
MSMFHRLSFVRADSTGLPPEFFAGPNVNRARQAAIIFMAGHYEPVAEMHGILPCHTALALFRTLTQNGGASDCWSVRPPPTIQPLRPNTVTRNNLECGRRSSMIGDIIEFGAIEAGLFVPMSRYVLDWQDSFAEMAIGDARRIIIAGGSMR